MVFSALRRRIFRISTEATICGQVHKISFAEATYGRFPQKKYIRRGGAKTTSVFSPFLPAPRGGRKKVAKWHMHAKKKYSFQRREAKNPAYLTDPSLILRGKKWRGSQNSTVIPFPLSFSHPCQSMIDSGSDARRCLCFFSLPQKSCQKKREEKRR